MDFLLTGLLLDRAAGTEWASRLSLVQYTVLKCIRAAALDAKLTKRIGCHTLRHSYATHLLEDGVDLRTIQMLLGHRSIRSTIGYLHLTRKAMKNVHRSLNDLMGDL